jgi:thiamine biosynthesis lipoprotein
LVIRAAVAAAALAVALGCATEPVHRYRAIVMGTEATVSVAGDEALARDAARAAFARMHAIEAVLSDYRSDSEAMRLARVVGAAQPASEDLLRVLAVAAEVHELSDGGFDVTVGPLTALWREARRTGVAPSADALEDARRRSGAHLLALDRAAGAIAFAVEGMRLDFGGIGKGYAAQEALRTLEAHGAERAMVAIAGDIALGAPPRGRAGWRVAIDMPDGSRVTLALRDCCVSTSGDSEQWFELDGVRRSHVVDPRTGLGATSRTQVTVIGSDGAFVDALASAASILEPADADAFLARAITPTSCAPARRPAPPVADRTRASWASATPRSRALGPK